MDWLSSVIVVDAIVALLVRASSSLPKEERATLVGFLDLLLAGILSSFLIAIYSGSLLLAPELAAIMVNSGLASWLVRSILIVKPVLPALCWYTLQKMNHETFRLWIVMVPALLIGICCAIRVVLLDPDVPIPLRVEPPERRMQFFTF